MYSSDDIRKISKIFIVIFLCNEMQSSITHNSSYEERIMDYKTNINTTLASFSTARHHASIRLKDLDHHYGEGHICSGAVIASSVVLTTAQCVYNYHKNKPYHPSELKVVLNSLSRYQRIENTLVYSVTHCYQPNTFNALNLQNNLAILMLDSDIPITHEYVKPIIAGNTNWYDKPNKENFKVTAWLKTNEGFPLNHLMVLNASQINDDICSDYYGNSLYTTGMLCVNTEENFHEDFGSPLFVDNKLVGLKSFASNHLSPAIYTDITHHIAWIREIIGDGTNQNSSFFGTLGFVLLTVMALRRTKFMKL